MVARRVAIAFVALCLCVAAASHLGLLGASTASASSSLSSYLFALFSPPPHHIADPTTQQPSNVPATDATSVPVTPPSTTSTSPLLPRVLLIMGDNRPIQSPDSVNSLADLDEVTSAVVVNYHYTTLHPNTGFRYLRYSPLDPNLLTSLSRPSNKSKHAPTCFNSHLRQLRAAPWCKLQAVYYATQHFPDYDVVFFIDTDAVISNYRLSPSAFLHSVPSSPLWCSAAEFLTEGSPCAVVFFDNQPWEGELPNTGAWLVRRSEYSAALLREWWHFDHESRNYYHAYEQDSIHLLVWDTLQRRLQQQPITQHLHLLSTPLDSLLGLLNATSMKHVSESQYIHHYTSPDKDLRKGYFQHVLRLMGEDAETKGRLEADVKEVLRRIAAEYVVPLDVSVDHIPVGEGLHDAEGKAIDFTQLIHIWKGKLINGR